MKAATYLELKKRKQQQQQNHFSIFFNLNYHQLDPKLREAKLATQTVLIRDFVRQHMDRYGVNGTSRKFHRNCDNGWWWLCLLMNSLELGNEAEDPMYILDQPPRVRYHFQ